MSEYKTTVGIELHAELKTASKMFCGCKNDPHASEANANVCPVCMAHPGTLPVVNKEAVEMVLRVGKAIGGELADYSRFDRKNYFYPDIPKAYQISQSAFHFVKGGEVAGVAITEIHLEEDTARSQHGEDASLVDFNRAGVPLMELVTEPVIHSGKEAGDFGRELQLLLRTLGVSDANMEKGEMRVEVNISVSKTEELGTKVEVKNINSFKAAEAAVEYETKRHIAALENGEVIRQETRGWDETKAVTFSQRSKETAKDYRYFPDPDIPKYKLSKVEAFNDSRLAEKIPKLAPEYRVEYLNLGLQSEVIETIVGSLTTRNFFDKVCKELADPILETKIAANYLTTDMLGAENPVDVSTLSDKHITAFVSLVAMVSAKEITSRVAKDLLPEILISAENPKMLAESRGLLQKNSADDLEPLIDEVLKGNEAAVAEYKAGKETALKFLVGQGMKASRGSANPELLAELLAKKMQ